MYNDIEEVFDKRKKEELKKENEKLKQENAKLLKEVELLKHLSLGIEQCFNILSNLKKELPLEKFNQFDKYCDCDDCDCDDCDDCDCDDCDDCDCDDCDCDCDC